MVGNSGHTLKMKELALNFLGHQLSSLYHTHKGAMLCLWVGGDKQCVTVYRLLIECKHKYLKTNT